VPVVVRALTFAFVCFTGLVVALLGIYYLPIPAQARLVMAVLLGWASWCLCLAALIVAAFAKESDL
jgi:uncharacterized membrane protein HdeD (DUF308 family)